MALAPGARLGVYEVVSLMGEGGMGQVYRAKDTRLKRDVALKILPDAFAADPDRVARFQREAELLATLNHPNIAAIYGFEDADGVHALVLELVEGPTLADRIAKGPIPLDDALPITKQIAEALEAAHEQGIVHRDLKPANIKIRDDGTVKVLDFGLAKALEPLSALRVDLANSPTITSPAMMTGVGMILGTAAYMSPEQARGRAADRRTDIWALGCIFYEMLTGDRAFRGDDITETLASIIRDEPNWARVPVLVRRALQACLDKNPKRRLRDIGDLWHLFDQDATATASVQPIRSGAWVWSILAGVVASLIAAATTLALMRKPAPAKPQPLRFHVAFPPNATPGRASPTLSPDGQRLAFLATDNRTAQTRVWIHELDALESRPLAGTEDAIGTPFWLADSQTIVFGVGQYRQPNTLKKIDIDGGPALSVTQVPGTLERGFSTSDSTFVLGVTSQPILRFSGGVLTRLTTLDPGETHHAFPALLPDGVHFIYVRSRGVNDDAIYVNALNDAPNTLPRLLRKSATNPAYVSGGEGRGFVVFAREGALLALPFDERRLKAADEPIVIGQGVGAGVNDPNIPLVTGSATGPIAYEETGELNYRQLKWFDRGGTVTRVVDAPTNYITSALRLSPSGTRAIVGVRAGSTAELWLIDLERGGRTKLVSNTATNWAPIWSPDSSSVIYTSSVKSPAALYRKSLDVAGSDERLVDGVNASDWSRDGRFVLFQFGNDLGLLQDPIRNSRSAVPLSHSNETSVGFPTFSPDGRWIAYGSGDVYLRAFDPDAPRRPVADIAVSTNGGSFPRWRGDGKELFYQAGRQIVSVTVDTSVPKLGKPQTLFELPPGSFSWDVTPDGQRFLVLAPVGDFASPPFTWLLNWQTALKKK